MPASPVTRRVACWRASSARWRRGTDLVILQPGTNDERYGSGAERAGNIAEMDRRLAARGTKLLIIENSMLAELPASELREDGIHYTPQGYAILAQRVLPLLLDALGKR
jgi:acyl-CoA thioesterase I